MSLDGVSAGDPAPDVLGSGSEHEPRLTPAVRRRLRLGGVAILVSSGAVAAGSELQVRRTAATEARRLADLWQVSADGPYGLGLESEPPPSLTAMMTIKLSLRNDGPQDVTVTHAGAGELVLLAPVPLPARTRREVVLHQELDCSSDTLLPAPAPPDRTTSDPSRWPGPLQVTAETGRDTRAMTFDRPPYDTELAAVACDRVRSEQRRRLGGFGRFGSPTPPGL